MKTDLRDPKVVPAPTERLAPSGRLERRVNLVSPGYLVTQEDKDPRAPVASLDSSAPTERKEEGVSLVNLDPEDNVAQRVPVVEEVPEDQLESQVLREHQATTDLPVDQEREDLKDPRGQSASQVLRAQTGPLVKTECLVTLGREERQVSRERLAHLGLEVL